MIEIKCASKHHLHHNFLAECLSPDSFQLFQHRCLCNCGCARGKLWADCWRMVTIDSSSTIECRNLVADKAENEQQMQLSHLQQSL